MHRLQMSGPSTCKGRPTYLPRIEALRIHPGEVRQLERFEVSTLELLHNRKLTERREHKFLFSRRALEHFFTIVRDDFRIVRSNGRLWGSYYTLYFDSPDFGFFRQHRRGRRPRHKVRIRHYVERDVCYLETKTKDRYETTAKERFLRSPHDFELAEADQSMIAGAVGSSQPLTPSLWVTFPRVTLVGTESLERITIDLGLQVSFGQERIAFPNLAIVELKQRRFDLRTPGYLAARKMGARPQSLSKYCTGLSVLGRVERTATFKPAIREIRRKCHA